MTNTWTSDAYRRHAAFVPSLGAAVLDLLAPQPGERVLDLGCGEGTLTAQIAERGACVVGVDSSPDMVAAATRRGLDARVMNGEALAFAEEFDAVFSNAALHWMRDADAVLRGVARALKPGGRFVGEFGGRGNVAAIQGGIRAVLERRGLAWTERRYYPSDDEYGRRLAEHGFSVQSIALIPRPTPLETGLRRWLSIFEQPVLEPFSPGERERVIDEIEDLLRPSLCDDEGRWVADYVRLRFKAVKTGNPAVASASAAAT